MFLIEQTKPAGNWHMNIIISRFCVQHVAGRNADGQQA